MGDMFVHESTGIEVILGLTLHVHWNCWGWKKPVISQHEEVKEEFMQYTETFTGKRCFYVSLQGNDLWIKAVRFSQLFHCQVVALSLKDLATTGYFKFVAPDPKVFYNMVPKLIPDRIAGNIVKQISNASEISSVSFSAGKHRTITGVKSLTCPSFTNMFLPNTFHIKQ